MSKFATTLTNQPFSPGGQCCFDQSDGQGFKMRFQLRYGKIAPMQKSRSIMWQKRGSADSKTFPMWSFRLATFLNPLIRHTHSLLVC